MARTNVDVCARLDDDELAVDLVDDVVDQLAEEGVRWMYGLKGGKRTQGMHRRTSRLRRRRPRRATWCRMRRRRATKIFISIDHLISPRGRAPRGPPAPCFRCRVRPGAAWTTRRWSCRDRPVRRGRGTVPSRATGASSSAPSSSRSTRPSPPSTLHPQSHTGTPSPRPPASRSTPPARKRSSRPYPGSRTSHAAPTSATTENSSSPATTPASSRSVFPAPSSPR